MENQNRRPGDLSGNKTMGIMMYFLHQMISRLFIFMTFCVMFVFSARSVASVGDSIDQAIQKYGEPYAVMKSGMNTIHLYETKEHGKIREVYDQKDKCFESDTRSLKNKNPSTHRNTYKTSKTKQHNGEKFTVTYNPQNHTQVKTIQQADARELQPESLDTKQTDDRLSNASNAETNERSKILKYMLWVSLSLLCCLTTLFAYYKYKYLPIAKERGDTGAKNSIEWLCTHFQKRNNPSIKGYGQQDPDKSYYKNCK